MGRNNLKTADVRSQILRLKDISLEKIVPWLELRTMRFDCTSNINKGGQKSKYVTMRAPLFSNFQWVSGTIGPTPKLKDTRLHFLYEWRLIVRTQLKLELCGGYFIVMQIIGVTVCCTGWFVRFCFFDNKSQLLDTACQSRERSDQLGSRH